MLSSGISFTGSTGQFVQNIARNSKRVGVAVEQLSSGKRINRPSDDPAGFVAAEEIRGELNELRSENKAATLRRVDFLRRVGYSRIQASLAPKDGPLETAADPSINVDESEVSEITPSADYSAAIGSRVDEVFATLRQDKEVILVGALSLIEDTDFAVATAELAQGQILSQASVVALAYATQQMTDQMTELMDQIDLTVE